MVTDLGTTLNCKTITMGKELGPQIGVIQDADIYKFYVLTK